MPYNIIAVKFKMSEKIDNDKKISESTDITKKKRPKAKDFESLSKALKKNLLRRKMASEKNE